MIRLVPFLLYLWLIGLHQVFLAEFTSIYGIEINLPALLVLLVAIYKSELDSCWFGFLVGFVAQAGFSSMTGWYALSMALIGLLAYHVRVRINLENLLSRLAVVFSGVFIHSAILLILSGSDQWLYQLFTQALLGAMYTTLVGWAFFLIKEGKITFRKFKAIF
jgi:rod shape-determining protein MreD